jgi:hypothetical protein
MLLETGNPAQSDIRPKLFVTSISFLKTLHLREATQESACDYIANYTVILKQTFEENMAYCESLAQSGNCFIVSYF